MTPVPPVAPTNTPVPTAVPTVVPTKVPRDHENEDDNDDEADSSHESILSGSVGKAKSGAAKTDIYEVTCAKGTEALAASVRDLDPAKASVISIQSHKRKASSALSTDSIDGDPLYSPSETLAAGPGKYKINVNKSRTNEKGAEAYTAKVSCKNANGSSPASKVKIVKNQ